MSLTKRARVVPNCCVEEFRAVFLEASTVASSRPELLSSTVIDSELFAIELIGYTCLPAIVAVFDCNLIGFRITSSSSSSPSSSFSSSLLYVFLVSLYVLFFSLPS
jgi:hypothetical protein